MATKRKKLTSLPLTIEVDHRGAFITRKEGTFKEQVADFNRRYKTKSGLPSGVIAAGVVDLVSRKVVSTVGSPFVLDKPTL